MPKYSRVQAGRSVDVVTAASPAAAAAIFGPTLFVGGDFLLVPNETLPGAALTIVDGAVTAIENPTPPTPPTIYRLLTPNQVVDLMLAAIGVAGFAACVRSDLDAMVTWRYKMDRARDISRDQAAAGLTIIVAGGLMTAAQRTAILDAWPTA